MIGCDHRNIELGPIVVGQKGCTRWGQVVLFGPPSRTLGVQGRSALGIQRRGLFAPLWLLLSPSRNNLYKFHSSCSTPSPALFLLCLYLFN